MQSYCFNWCAKFSWIYASGFTFDTNNLAELKAMIRHLTEEMRNLWMHQDLISLQLITLQLVGWWKEMKRNRNSISNKFNFIDVEDEEIKENELNRSIIPENSQIQSDRSRFSNDRDGKNLIVLKNYFLNHFILKLCLDLLNFPSILFYHL